MVGSLRAMCKVKLACLGGIECLLQVTNVATWLPARDDWHAF